MVSHSIAIDLVDDRQRCAGIQNRGTSAAKQRCLVAPRNHRLTPTLATDDSGAAFVEYVVVLLLVSVIAAIATYSLGRPFVDYYRFAQLIVSLPFP